MPKDKTKESKASTMGEFARASRFHSVTVHLYGSVMKTLQPAQLHSILKPFSLSL